MATSTHAGRDELSFWEKIRKRRRKRIKRAGKRLIRGLADFLGRQSLVGNAPVLDKTRFPEVMALEANWRAIRAELDDILKHREAVPLLHQVSPDQKRISTGTSWRTFILFGFGNKLVKNCTRAPETTRLLEQIPNLQTAWFSILSPRYHIPAHRGITKGILRCHLGLVVPEDVQNCTLRLDDQVYSWKEGEAVLFDDTYEHEVLNDTDDDRVVLLIDFDRPMRIWGRMLHKSFLALLKLTAYYRDPASVMRSYEDQFETAVRQAEETRENLSQVG